MDGEEFEKRGYELLLCMHTTSMKEKDLVAHVYRKTLPISISE